LPPIEGARPIGAGSFPRPKKSALAASPFIAGAARLLYNYRTFAEWPVRRQTRTARALQVLMPSQNIQDAFLNTARKERLPVVIYLTSGVKLSGRVRGFDKYCVVFETNHQEQLIFKHAISTVVTSRPHHHPAGAPRAEEPAEKEETAHVPGLPAS
jgi:host factor-I protein